MDVITILLQTFNEKLFIDRCASCVCKLFTHTLFDTFGLFEPLLSQSIWQLVIPC